jgi:hypothetical protein
MIADYEKNSVSLTASMESWKAKCGKLEERANKAEEEKNKYKLQCIALNEKVALLMPHEKQAKVLKDNVEELKVLITQTENKYEESKSEQLSLCEQQTTKLQNELSEQQLKYQQL